MMIGEWKVESTPYMDEFYKINKDLLGRLLAKYPHKSKWDFIEHKVYLMKNEKLIVCSPFTYSFLIKEKNGTSSNNLINNFTRGIANLSRTNVS